MNCFNYNCLVFFSESIDEVEKDENKNVSSLPIGIIVAAAAAVLVLNVATTVIVIFIIRRKSKYFLSLWSNNYCVSFSTDILKLCKRYLVDKQYK